MKLILSVPSAGIRTAALSPEDVYGILTDYRETGYSFDEIEIEDHNKKD